jgi:hypothetical protein
MRNHKATIGSKVWNRITKTWKEFVLEVSMNNPFCYKEWLNLSFWWIRNNGNLGPNFLRERATELYHIGVQCICHV